MQIKFFALNIFEERKWKKGVSYVLANEISNKLKKQNAKNKLDQLYRRCMCLYISITVKNNYTEIRNGQTNKNMSNELNNYIQNNKNIGDVGTQFEHWKNQIIHIKEKLDKNFSLRTTNAKNFLKIITLMDNMVSMQLETQRKLKDLDIPRNLFTPEKNQESNDLFELELDMNNYRLSKDFENRNSLNRMDLETVDKEMHEVMEQITKEFNENEIMLTDPSKDIRRRKSSNISQSEKLNNSNIISNMFNNNNNMDINPLDVVDPKQLFYDTEALPKDFNEIKIVLEKMFTNSKVDKLPIYDYKNLINQEYDINDLADDFEKAFQKNFPSIFYDSKSTTDKSLIESEIENYRNKHERLLKDPEAMKLYSLKFGNFTIVQQLVMFWALTNYAFNLHIISEIPNIFNYSRSISYDVEEIKTFLDRNLENMGIDMSFSNFNNIIYNSSKFKPYVQQSEAPMLNSSDCNFYYNKKSLEFTYFNRENVNDANSIKPTANISYNIKSTNLDYEHNLIISNPIYFNQKIKNDMLIKLKSNLMNVCNKVLSLNKSLESQSVIINDERTNNKSNKMNTRNAKVKLIII